MEYQTAGSCVDCGGRVVIKADPVIGDSLNDWAASALRRKLADAWTWGRGREELIDRMHQQIDEQAAEIARLKAEYHEEREKLDGTSRSLQVHNAKHRDQHEEEIRTLTNERNQQRRAASDAKTENLKLKNHIRQLEQKNAMLAAENDNLKQRAIPLPVVCKCGCGLILEQPATGRPKEYVNEAHKKKYYRRQKKTSR